MFSFFSKKLSLLYILQKRDDLFGYLVVDPFGGGGVDFFQRVAPSTTLEYIIDTSLALELFWWKVKVFSETFGGLKAEHFSTCRWLVCGMCCPQV